jgi:hypothetical protein
MLLAGKGFSGIEELMLFTWGLSGLENKSQEIAAIKTIIKVHIKYLFFILYLLREASVGEFLIYYLTLGVL